MSSFFSTLLGPLQELQSEIMDILDLLHTASIEFTVVREGNCVIGLEVRVQCLLAEQKTAKATILKWDDDKKAWVPIEKGSIKRY